MEVEFACPHCAHKVRIDTGFLGQEGQCPYCEKVLSIPAIDPRQLAKFPPNAVIKLVSRKTPPPPSRMPAPSRPAAEEPADELPPLDDFPPIEETLKDLHAPAPAAAAKTDKPDNRRQSERFLCPAGMVEIWRLGGGRPQNPVRYPVRDLSIGGIGITFSLDLTMARYEFEAERIGSVGRKVQMILYPNNIATAVRLRGSVCRVEQKNEGRMVILGIRFEGLDAATLRQLADLQKKKNAAPNA